MNGKAVSDELGITMAWASWPMDVLQPLGLASAGSMSAPAETLDGRPAEVYDLDTARVDATTLGEIQAMLPLNPRPDLAKGRIWIDQQTGGLLKLTLDYVSTFKDPTTGKGLGTANGHVEIVVTQVGKVTVRLP